MSSPSTAPAAPLPYRASSPNAGAAILSSPARPASPSSSHPVVYRVGSPVPKVSVVSSPARPASPGSATRAFSLPYPVSTSVTSSAPIAPQSITRGGSVLKRDESRSTAEGEWEMRDGKWYRKDYYAAQFEKPKACVMCPVHLERINILIRELEQLKVVITERDRLIAELQTRLQKWDIESREVVTTRQQLQARTRELELLVKEKEAIILQLNEKIRIVLEEKETTTVQIRKLTQTIEEYERRFANCKCNASEEPVQWNISWYYAVQDQTHAEIFQKDPLYEGGNIVTGEMEAATIVNPEYYTQAEKVPGTARLRVRVVDFEGPICHGDELFVRMKLGEATQFTQALPYQNRGVSWNQDMVFVEVPLKPHPFDASATCSVHPLDVEVVARVIGTADETVVGTASLDLRDLVRGLTRILVVPLTSGGAVNLRIRAMDFGLPHSSNVVQGWMSTTAKVAPPSLERVVAAAAASPAPAPTAPQVHYARVTSA